MKLQTLVIGAAICGHMYAATPAVAQVSDRTSIVTSVDTTDIRCVDAHVPELTAASLTTKIYGPRDGAGRRVLWQICRSFYSGPGRYRCGIDVAVGSLAQAAKGAWLTVVAVDSTRVARKSFTI